MQERSDYRSAKRQRISETGTVIHGTNQNASGTNTVISNVSTGNTAAPTIPTSIMGGRNEQHSLRSRNHSSSGN